MNDTIKCPPPYRMLGRVAESQHLGTPGVLVRARHRQRDQHALCKAIADGVLARHGAAAHRTLARVRVGRRLGGRRVKEAAQAVGAEQVSVLALRELSGVRISTNKMIQEDAMNRVIFNE